MFEELALLINILMLVEGLLLLNKASNWTIANSVKIAEITGFGKTTVGFILVAFSTSLPELSVSVFAALGQGGVGVAIGNVLGSNIVNICLILGICFLISVRKCKMVKSVCLHSLVLDLSDVELCKELDSLTL